MSTQVNLAEQEQGMSEQGKPKRGGRKGRMVYKPKEQVEHPEAAHLGGQVPQTEQGSQEQEQLKQGQQEQLKQGQQGQQGQLKQEQQEQQGQGQAPKMDQPKGLPKEVAQETAGEAADEARAAPKSTEIKEKDALQESAQEEDENNETECCENPSINCGHGQEEDTEQDKAPKSEPEELGDFFVHEGTKLIIKKGCVPNMRTEGLCFANKQIVQVLLDEYRQHRGQRGGLIPSLHQIANVAALPGIVGHSLAMPDVHCGYGFAIGGVAAMDTEDPSAVVSPGGVGFDINCGVRLLKTNLTVDQVMKVQDALMDNLFGKIAVGVGTSGSFNISMQDLDQVLQKGVKWLLEKKFCWPEDVENCEENGCMAGADASKVSQRAKRRGKPQLGTLGSGNHYVEVQVVNEIFDEKAAKAFGLFKDQVCIMIHTGSRGLGHQVCTDFLQIMSRTMSQQGIKVNDRQLAACKIGSPEGKDYLAAMAASANFAFCNRTIIANHVRKAFEEVFRKSARDLEMYLLYDVCHNTAKFEDHEIKGKKKRLLVHRKGATRSFPPNHPQIPKAYKDAGQPVLIGGSMGTSSYVLTGTESAMKESWGSTCHGAGRQASRAQAKRDIPVRDVFDDLRKKGIAIRVAQKGLVSEEAVGAYKDVDEVVQTCHDAGLSKKCVHLRPIGVLKG